MGNADIPLLESLRGLEQGILLLERRYKWQKQRMLHIREHHFDGMPKSGRAEDFGDAYASLQELNEKYEALIREYAALSGRAWDILGAIPSPVLRDYVEMKYIERLTDREIRGKLKLTRYAMERLKESVEGAPCMAEARWQENAAKRGRNA